MDLHLRGKRVLITGASKGIGAAAAEGLDQSVAIEDFLPVGKVSRRRIQAVSGGLTHPVRLAKQGDRIKDKIKPGLGPCSVLKSRQIRLVVEMLVA